MLTPGYRLFLTMLSSLLWLFLLLLDSYGPRNWPDKGKHITILCLVGLAFQFITCWGVPLMAERYAQPPEMPEDESLYS